MIEILLSGLLQCILLQDIDEFWMCLDQVVVEYNQTVSFWRGGSWDVVNF